MNDLTPDQQRKQDLIAYLKRQRRAFIDRYFLATLWVQRKDARAWVLHYGRLLRKAGSA